MRFCYNCRRLTSGVPRFCQYCARSYDVRICPRLHVNPVEAQACSQCGSRILSTPQPRHPWWIRPLKVFWVMLPGISMLGISALYLLAYLWMLFFRPELQLIGMLGGLALGLLWLLYIK